MKDVLLTTKVELLKIRKSNVFRSTVIFFVIVSSMMALVMFVQKYPESSGKLGMIGNKANMMSLGEANWENYFSLLMQGIAGVGLLGIGFVSSWVFGREFSDRTLKDLLALPVARQTILHAKLIVIILWVTLLFVVFLVTSFAYGKLLHLEGLSTTVLMLFLQKYFTMMTMMFLLITPIVYLAGKGRGIIFPLSVSILTLLMANFSGMVGLGPYFPWSIPGLYGIAPAGIQIGPESLVILFSTGLVFYFTGRYWWKYTDQQ